MRGTLALTIMFDLVVNSGKEAAEKSQTRRVISRVSAGWNPSPARQRIPCGGEVRVSPREILGHCPCAASASHKVGAVAVGRFSFIRVPGRDWKPRYRDLCIVALEAQAAR